MSAFIINHNVFSQVSVSLFAVISDSGIDIEYRYGGHGPYDSDLGSVLEPGSDLRRAATQ